MQQQGWRLTGHSCGAARAVRVATIENVAASNAVGVQEAWLTMIGSFFDMALYPSLFVAYTGTTPPYAR